MVMVSRRAALAAGAFVLVFLFWALPAMAGAAGGKRYVGGAGAADGGNDCLEGAHPCATIQHAIEEAAAGDAIVVAAGSYDEQLTIAKALTVEGDPHGGTVIGPNPESRGVEQTEVTLAGGSSGTTLRDLAIVSRALGATWPAIATAAPGPIDDVTLEGVGVHGGGPAVPFGTVASGLEVSVPAAGWTIVDSNFDGNYHGMLVSGDMSDLTIEGSSFSANRTGLYVERSLPLGPTSTGTIEGLQLRDSRFEDNEYEGLYFEGLSEAAIERIAVLGTGQRAAALPFGAHGIAFNLKAGNYNHIAIADSTVADTVNEGIVLQVRGYSGDTAYESTPASLDSLRLSGLTLSGNGGPGLAVDNEANIGSVEVSGSRFVGNGGQGAAGPAPVNGIFAWNETVGAPTVAAADNWFGCNAGPRAAGSACEIVNGPVAAAPWLVLTATASQTTVHSGQSTTIIAAIDSNSSGRPAPSAPDGTPVSFVTDSGALAPATATLRAGRAASTLTMAAPGTAHLSVSVDGETVPLAVQAVAPPPPPTPTLPEPPATEPPSVEAPHGAVVAHGANPRVGTVGCGSSACRVEASHAVVRIGHRKVKLAVRLRTRIGAGRSAAVKVKLPRSVRRALARGKVGRVTVRVKLTDATGRTVVRTIKVKIKAKRHRGAAHRHRGAAHRHRASSHRHRGGS